MIEPKTVCNYIGRSPKKGNVGLELEVEAKAPLPEIYNNIWQCKPEPSLRGYGMEYVTKGPIECDRYKYDIIKSLIDQLVKSKPDPNSPRTSLHVHVNVGHLTPLQLWTAATGYWLVENVLMKYCGEEQREANLFCLRLKDAEGVIKVCKNDINHKYPFKYIRTDKIRYGALNLNAVPKFGSMEYRGMRGTLDPDIIHTWSNEVNNLVNKAATVYKDPADLMDTCASSGKAHIIESLFSHDFANRLKETPNWRALMDENIGTLCGLAYMQDDWTKWAEREFNKPKTFKGIPLDTPINYAMAVKASRLGLICAYHDESLGTYIIDSVQNENLISGAEDTGMFITVSNTGTSSTSTTYTEEL